MLEALRRTPPDFFEAAKHATDENHGVKPAEWSQFLHHQFAVSQDIVADESLAQARCLWQLGSSVIITTNYDRVLEWASPEKAETLHIENAFALERFLQGRSGGPMVWHLHGDIGHPHELILLPEGYDALYPPVRDSLVKQRFEAALATLHAVLMTRRLLFIGFSFADIRFGEQLDWLRKTFGGQSGPHYALVHKDRLAAVVDGLKSVDVECIPYTDHEAGLLSLLTEFKAIANPASEESGGGKVDQITRRTYRVEPLNNGATPPPHIINGALADYTANTPEEMATKPDELLALKDSYNDEFRQSGDKYCLYALTVDGADTPDGIKAVGFAMLATFVEQRFVYFDTLVIAKGHTKGNTEFFAEGIRKNLEGEIDPDYLAVEWIGRDLEKTSRSDDRHNRTFHRWLGSKHQRFRQAAYPYRAPPMYDGSIYEGTRCALFVRDERADSDWIPITRLKTIIDCIILWYDRWVDLAETGETLRESKALLSELKSYNQRQMQFLSNKGISSVRLHNGYYHVPPFDDDV
jgi:hypothetical protein